MLNWSDGSFFGFHFFFGFSNTYFIILFFEFRSIAEYFSCQCHMCDTPSWAVRYAFGARFIFCFEYFDSMLINEIIQTILKWLMTFELCATWNARLNDALLRFSFRNFFFYSFFLCTLNIYSPFHVDSKRSFNNFSFSFFQW